MNKPKKFKETKREKLKKNRFGKKSYNKMNLKKNKIWKMLKKIDQKILLCNKPTLS